MREYYLINYITSKHSLFLIWYNDDENGFACSDSSIIFTALTDVEYYCEKNKITLSSSISTFNCDNVKLSKNKMYSSDDCKNIIDIWNLYSDISTFLNIEYIGNQQDNLTLEVYDKLVYGSKIKILKHDEYHPSFDNDEIKRLSDVLNDGYLMIVNQL